MMNNNNTMEEVKVDTPIVETPTPEVIEMPQTEMQEVTPERKELIKNIIDVYQQCFEFSKGYLEGKNLRTRFETVEKTARLYKKNEEKSLEHFRSLLEKAENEFKLAVKEFEAKAEVELDPTSYDTIVLDKEIERDRLNRIVNNKITVIQGLRNKITSLFARDKKLIPSLIHSQAMVLTLHLIHGSIKEEDGHPIVGELTEKTIKALEYIKEHITDCMGNLTKESEIDDIVEFLAPISEHSVDRSASISRSYKDALFEYLEKTCTERNIQIIKPDDFETNQEAQILYATNQLKALKRLLSGGTVVNPDGSLATKFQNVRERDEVLANIQGAGFIFTGVTSIMEKSFIDGLPFRKDSIKANFISDIDRINTLLTRNHYYKDTKVETKDIDKDLLFRNKMITSTILLSLTTVDQIPMTILMM